jgi:restriction system protein
VDYLGMVLDRSRYPEGFPAGHKLAFVPESKQVVVEHDLPTFDVIPEEKGFKYVKSRDEITAASRPETQRKTLYSSVIAQVALRTVHELYEADRRGHVETVVYNGMVESIDKRTGTPARVCVISFRTTRDTFEELNLDHVDPEECLKGLNAGVSKKPAELAPVRPVVEFKMVDDRFADESDVLSELDQRPNLMQLTPSEFESVITNLFEQMGLETRQTRPSRDGGVDCVAWDARPVMGGKVVIQAKRYKGTVGVSAVRDLFGTVHNEGASKGILVTTSGYGKASFEFADGKPLELLDGNNLLYLLSEHAGVEAKIEPPEDWIDPEKAAIS